MSSKETATSAHFCDLCGEQREEDEPTSLYDKDQVPFPASRSMQADVCTECQKRPIADVLSCLEQLRKAADLLTVKVRTGVKW